MKAVTLSLRLRSFVSVDDSEEAQLITPQSLRAFNLKITQIDEKHFFNINKTSRERSVVTSSFLNAEQIKA